MQRGRRRPSSQQANNKASAAKQPAIRPRPQSPTKTGPKLATRRREHHTCRSLLSLPPPHPPPSPPLAPNESSTASSNASATGQTQSQQTAKQALQGKRPSNRSPLPPPHRKRRPTPKRRPGRGHRSRGVMGHKRHALISTTTPLAPFPRRMLLVGIGVGPRVAVACSGETRHPLAMLP